MPYTMEDFKRDYMKEHVLELTPQEKKDLLKSLPPEQLLAALSEEQIRRYLERFVGRGSRFAAQAAAEEVARCRSRRRRMNALQRTIKNGHIILDVQAALPWKCADGVSTFTAGLRRRSPGGRQTGTAAAT
jgi:hypothetical protein